MAPVAPPVPMPMPSPHSKFIGDDLDHVVLRFRLSSWYRGPKITERIYVSCIYI